MTRSNTAEAHPKLEIGAVDWMARSNTAVYREDGPDHLVGLFVTILLDAILSACYLWLPLEQQRPLSSSSSLLFISSAEVLVHGSSVADIICNYATLQCPCNVTLSNYIWAKVYLFSSIMTVWKMEMTIFLYIYCIYSYMWLAL